MDHRPPDPRARALAGYLRERAAAFSLSADSTDERHIAAAGMALLDAAALAEGLPPDDRRLQQLSMAGRFEATGDDTCTFVESADVRAAVQRPLSGRPMSGEGILALLVSTVRGDDDPG